MDVKSGEVLAYVGNVYDPADRSEGTSVDVVRAPRSSGSVLKPLLYAAMLDNGTALPTMLFPDVPTYYKDFTPQNFNHDFSGAVPANRVIERSLNVPSVKMLDKYGRENFLALVRNLGFGTIDRSADHYGLSLILGGAEITLWDLTSVYAMLAAKARRRAGPHPALRSGGRKDGQRGRHSAVEGCDMAYVQFDKPCGPS